MLSFFGGGSAAPTDEAAADAGVQVRGEEVDVDNDNPNNIKQTTQPHNEEEEIVFDEDSVHRPERKKASVSDDSLRTPSWAASSSSLLSFEDHHSLLLPSNSVRYRGSTIRLGDKRNSQWQLQVMSSSISTKEEEEEEQGQSSHDNPKSIDNNNQQQHASTTTTILIKNVANDKATNLNLLRLSYTTVAFFYVGFLFVLCFQTLLFLFMDLVVDAGLTDNQGADPFRFIGTLLSLPVFLYGLSSAMALGGAFVSDIWAGHALLRHVGQTSLGETASNRADNSSMLLLVALEWLAFWTLLGVPLMTWIITLFVRVDEWWRVTLLTWFCCATVYYVVFSFLLMYYEVQAAWLILHELHPDEYPEEEENEDDRQQPGLIQQTQTVVNFLVRAMHHRQRLQYSAHTDLVRLSSSLDPDHNPDKQQQNSVNDDTKEKENLLQQDQNNWRQLGQLDGQKYGTLSLYAQMTTGNYSCLPDGYCLKRTGPERILTLYDIMGTRQFITRHNWSLEKIFCMHQRTQSVSVVRGAAALHPLQMKSSLACTLLGILLVVLLCVAGLVWMESTGLFIVIVAILIAFCCCFGRLQSTRRLYTLYDHVHNHYEDEEEEEQERQALEEDGGEGKEKPQEPPQRQLEEEEEDANIYQTFENYRISKPTRTTRWCMFTLEMVLFVIWPIIALFVINNYPVAVFFLVLCVISTVRYYLNPSILLQELKSLDAVYRRKMEQFRSANGEEQGDREPTPDEKRRLWNAKSRLFAILTNVTSGNTRVLWNYVFFLLALGVILFTVQALAESAEDSVSSSDEIVLTPTGHFVYEPQPNLPYPTCGLAKGLEIPNVHVTALADYAFLAMLAYQPPEVFQERLDDWFGDGVAKEEVEVVREFRQQVVGGNAAVSYHLVNFQDDVAVVVVRGSTTAWEWLTDAQLWSGAAFSQIIRGILPLGEIFTPIIHQLLNGMTFIESNSLSEVALYKQTTQLVRYLQSSGNYSKIHITGQSLGGGISLITGAQTAIPAIAISGPNNILSRKTFDPIFSLDDTKQFLFNVVPERDIVPRVDDLGMQHQEIRCRARQNDLFGCHSAIRSLCEIIYTCGSYNRPPLCECATHFGYPEAKQISGTKSYTDICGTCRTNDGYYSDCEG